MGLFDSVSTAIGAVASAVPGVGDYLAADEANKQNEKIANRNNAFSERLSNSSYQRAVQDLKAAGLNPMLAYSQGGASTPTPSTYTAQPKSASKFGEWALNSAFQKKKQDQDQAALQNATSKNAVDIQNVEANTANAKSTAAKQIAETQNIQVDTALKRKELPKKDIENKFFGAANKGADLIDHIFKSFSRSSARDSLEGLRSPDDPMSRNNRYQNTKPSLIIKTNSYKNK